MGYLQRYRPSTISFGATIERIVFMAQNMRSQRLEIFRLSILQPALTVD
jgi:hypothetical protein